MEKGQIVCWQGTRGLFHRPVRIVDIRNAYLVILGEGPENGETVYDIDDSFLNTIVYGIPAHQLHAIHDSEWDQWLEGGNYERGTERAKRKHE